MKIPLYILLVTYKRHATGVIQSLDIEHRKPIIGSISILVLVSQIVIFLTSFKSPSAASSIAWMHHSLPIFSITRSQYSSNICIYDGNNPHNAIKNDSDQMNGLQTF